jgi:GPI mannosyltransferase 4
VAIIVDTSFYTSSSALPLPWHLLHDPIIAPLNALRYNSSVANLSLHGLHPPYHHFVVSLPLLLGPALFLLPLSRATRLPLLSALSATFFLSLIPHQEPRFLLPAIPLVLSSIHLPQSRSATRSFLAAWVIFNTLLGILMGVYHQGGVVPVQIWLGQQRHLGVDRTLWWRTYSPPVWLLDGNAMQVTDLMGMEFEAMLSRVGTEVGDCDGPGVGLVAPRSSIELDVWTQSPGMKKEDLVFEEMWRYTRHVWGTIGRVIGRRGLSVWRVRRRCDERSNGT